ncbi:hypothetical protein JKA74_10685 [Marivirga sp. S37H4]|uniref:N-acetyltransferase domain-containing protein n=1 Tax=Marivirga aurantiaca TaxID=2802615 RepID=A0A934WYT4_9BACT|nr:hypothetical protein [Marivirga aurantiaca]MBK6265504.1 hypothetical protein [Marivirga aurantiaca]
MIKIAPYQPEFEEGIKALCRIPVSGNISLALEREPNYYAGACLQCEKPEIFVVYEESLSKVWAVFNAGKRRVWYRNEVVEVRYLCDLRIHPEKQQSPALYLIVKKFSEITANDLLPAQTVVFADNHKMLAIIEKLSQRKKTSQLPFYHLIGGLTTYMLGFNSPKETKENLDIRRATNDDIETMQAFFDKESPRINYSPYYNFSELERPYYRGLKISDFFLAYEKEKLVGVCGTWDQSGIKQTRIVGYSRTYQIIKPLYNLLASIFGRPLLPEAGKILTYLNVHSILVEESRTEVFEQLILRIQKERYNNGFDYLLCSLSEEGPLTKALDKLGADRKIKGKYYCVNFGEPLPQEFKSGHFYVESARI